MNVICTMKVQLQITYLNYSVEGPAFFQIEHQWSKLQWKFTRPIQALSMETHLEIKSSDQCVHFSSPIQLMVPTY